jgi:GR25 family glycosyltransferase involved in LPS biosynthesis
MELSVINLDRSHERMEQFRLRNSHLSVRRVSAVDGRTVDRHEVAAKGLIDQDVPFPPGSVGAALSHIGLWKTAVQAQAPLTIAEDDAIFAVHFATAAAEVLSRLTADWDLILWGWNYDAYLWVEIPEGVSRSRLQFNQDDLRHNVEVFRRSRHPVAPIRLRHAFGLLAYSVSPKGAGALLELCVPIKRRLIPFTGFDVQVEMRSVDRMMNFAYPRLRSYVCFPPLAVSENTHETSTIQGDNPR